MTPRERVYVSLRFQETDVVPYQVNLTSGMKKIYCDYRNDPNALDKVGNHLAIFSHRKASKWIEINPGMFQDEWGVIWNRSLDKDIGVVENRVLKKPSLKGFDSPNPYSETLFSKYPAFISANTDRFRISTIGFSLFERAWSLRGMAELLMDMVENPNFVHELFECITEFNLKQIEYAASYDIDCILFGDDWGTQAGMLMGPNLWRQLIKPCIKRMYERVRSHGKYVAIHSCGDIKEIFPDLVEAGLNIFNPFQPEVMDVYETKRSFYGKLSFYGGISVQNLLPHGSTDDVRKETRKLINELGKGGGYIAAPSHEVPSDCPPENIEAMIEVMQNQ